MHRSDRWWTRAILTTLVMSPVVSPRPTEAQVEVTLQELRLELDLGSSGEPVFHRVGGMALSDSDELYVADQFSRSVRVFDLQGRLLREFGGEGAGPGEFAYAGRIQLGDSTVRVTDSELRRVTTFSSDGTVLETETYRLTAPVDRSATRHSLSYAANLRMGWALAWSSPVLGFVDQPVASIDFGSYVLAVDGAGRRDTLLVEPRSREVFYRRDDPSLVSSGLGGGFGHSGLWDVSGDSLAAVLQTYTGRGRVFRITETGPQEVGVFDLGWRPLTADQPREVRAARGRVSEMRGGSPDDWEVTVPEYYAQSGRMCFADGERVWVHHDPDMGGGVWPERELWYRKEEPQRWYVVAWRSGRVLAIVETPGNFLLSGVKGDRLFGTHYDELDVQAVRVYRLPPIPEG